MVTISHFFPFPFNFKEDTLNSAFGRKQSRFPGVRQFIAEDLTTSSASGDADLRITTHLVQQWMAIRYGSYYCILMRIFLGEPSFDSVISHTGRNCDLSNDFLPFTSQDCLEYFGILYNESVSDLLSYHQEEPRPCHREYDSNNDPVKDGASPPSLVIQQENISDYPIEPGSFISPSQSSSESSHDTETTTPSTAPSSSATPGGAKQSLAGFQTHDGIYPRHANAFTCPQCHKAFPRNSVLR